MRLGAKSLILQLKKFKLHIISKMNKKPFWFIIPRVQLIKEYIQGFLWHVQIQMIENSLNEMKPIEKKILLIVYSFIPSNIGFALFTVRLYYSASRGRKTSRPAWCF